MIIAVVNPIGFVQESQVVIKKNVSVVIRKALIAVCLGAAACNAAALALGNSRGVVVLGRAIDLAFDVHTDPGKTLEDSCITAEVVSGDKPLPRVRVLPLPAVTGRAPAVRVQTSAIADEPVLSVTLRAGCSGKTSRTYTFLADLPESTVATARPIEIAALQQPGQTPRGAAATASTDAPDAKAGARPVAERASAAGSGAAVPGAARKAVEPALLEPRPRRKAAPAKKPAPLPAKAELPKSRLVMEPLEDWLGETPATLRLSTELNLPEVPATPQRRAQAQAEWKALNMRPEDVLQDSARMAALGQELSQALALTESERSRALQAQQQLQQEKEQRYSATVVYALVALVLAALAWVAWMALRQRQATAQARQDWERAMVRPPQAAAQEPAPPPVAARPVPAPRSVPAALAAAEPLSGAAPLAAPATAMVAIEPVAVPEPVVTTPPSGPVAELVPPVVAPAPELRINPEELFDLQQQAEFFVSVGEHNQAIEVMKKYIADNETTAPVAYLDLLRLYRSLSRVDDFNQLRAQFHRHFNARVPEFSAFNRPGRPLLTYPEILAQIEAIWSDESVLPLLDKLLFRRSATPPERFDLAAYDDLLLLNAIARTTPPSARGVPPPRERTTPAVSVVDHAVEPVQDPLLATSQPPPSRRAVGDDNLIEFDSRWLEDLPVQAEVPPRRPFAPSSLIDFDVSESGVTESGALPPLTQSDLPPVPPTAAPAPGQAVGFGAHNDRFEARHDPDFDKPKTGG